MNFTYDPKTGELSYNGQVVGAISQKSGFTNLKLNVNVSCKLEYLVVALSWFANSLKETSRNSEAKADAALAIETDEASIEEEYDAKRSLLEYKIKRGGYIWIFHKSDPDCRPSSLHGHDYDKGLVLDAVTGIIYDKVTQAEVKKLKAQVLVDIQSRLRSNSDFSDKARKLHLGETRHQ